MDTAEVVGLEAHNYYVSHVPRTLPDPVLTPEEAQARLSGRVTVHGVRLCLIPHHEAEVLCYEFSITLGDGEYYLYLAARCSAAMPPRKRSSTPLAGISVQRRSIISMHWAWA